MKGSGERNRMVRDAKDDGDQECGRKGVNGSGKR